MAYNNRNLYTKAIEVQCIVQRGLKRGDSKKVIFYNEVEPRYRISLKTFYNWIGMPAKEELEKLDRAKAAHEAARKA